MQGNWNYYAAVRGERKDPKLEATHLEKAKELYNKVWSNSTPAALLLFSSFARQRLSECLKSGLVTVLRSLKTIIIVRALS